MDAFAIIKDVILLGIAIIGSVVGVTGFFSGKDEVHNRAAEWRGEVNGKLDSILKLSPRVDDLEETVTEHEYAIRKLEDSSKRAHERIDDIKGGRG